MLIINVKKVYILKISIIFVKNKHIGVKAKMKNGNSVETMVVSEHGEVLNCSVVQHKYLTKDRDVFYLMYSSMVHGLLTESADINVRLFAALLRYGARGDDFAVNKALKESLSIEWGCSPRTLDNGFTFLIQGGYLIRKAKGLYKINPRHIFQGSSSDRYVNMKALVELGFEI